jgi:uncharacterized protein YdhG (YjbR/CyaY superfamily)
MQYQISTVSEYFKVLENDWRREKLEEIRKIIKKVGPNLRESISYKMLAYEDEKGILFHLNAQKNYVSFYVGDSKKVDPKGELLEGFDCGKGCIRIKKTINVADTKIDEFIKRCLQLRREGRNLDC